MRSEEGGKERVWLPPFHFPSSSLGPSLLPPSLSLSFGLPPFLTPSLSLFSAPSSLAPPLLFFSSLPSFLPFPFLHFLLTI